VVVLLVIIHAKTASAQRTWIAAVANQATNSHLIRDVSLPAKKELLSLSKEFALAASPPATPVTDLDHEDA
jgi:hypothetical protein